MECPSQPLQLLRHAGPQHRGPWHTGLRPAASKGLPGSMGGYTPDWCHSRAPGHTQGPLLPTGFSVWRSLLSPSSPACCCSHMPAYTPPFCSSSSCLQGEQRGAESRAGPRAGEGPHSRQHQAFPCAHLPRSAMCPSLSTRIWSAPTTVESLQRKAGC